MGGRLSRSSYPSMIKHPVIVPKGHWITKLLIRHCHGKVVHQGRGMTVNEIRNQGYWIINCCSEVYRYIGACVTCRKLRAVVQEQKMADLPEDRVEQAPPFQFCGVDYFGPYMIREGRRDLKRYGVLFTCMASRAVHIEIACSLSTDSFINALRRFIAVRGPVRQLRSDQGTNFVGAKRELQDCLKEMDNGAVKLFLLERQCDFVMNVPSASHQGGVWERQIRTVRSVLSAMIEPAGTQLNDESLRTFMSEVMAIVNNRPLTTDNLNDPNSVEPLTPNHLLTAKSAFIHPPPGKFQREDLYLRKQWRRVQHLNDVFWSRWQKEFLGSLQKRQKWTRSRRDVCVGDIVIIKDENLPRGEWKLARVSEVYRDVTDNHVRNVKLTIADRELDAKGKRVKKISELERPIQKLVILVESADE